MNAIERLSGAMLRRQVYFKHLFLGALVSKPAGLPTTISIASRLTKSHDQPHAPWYFCYGITLMVINAAHAQRYNVIAL